MIDRSNGVWRHRAAWVAIMLVGVSVARAEGDEAQPQQAAPVSPEPPPVIVIGTTDTLTDLDPATTYDHHPWEVQAVTMAGLLMADRDGRPQPVLAEAMPEVSADRLVWTVRLAKGIRFASGRELTAGDVVWSIDRVRRLGGEPSWFVTAFIKQVRAVDRHTVAFELLEPTSFFPSLLTVTTYFPVDRECVPADKPAPEATCAGIGRYSIAEWSAGKRLLLEANPSWPGKAPANPRIEVRYFARADAMRDALRSGAIDVAWRTLGEDDVAEARGADDLQVWTGRSAFKRNLVFVHSASPFDDPRVRRAVAYLVDREVISERVYHGAFRALYSPIPDAVPGHIPSMPRTDVERARTLLAAAGFGAERPLRFDLWWTPDHYGDQEDVLAMVIKEQLEASQTVEVTLKSAPWATYKYAAGECKYPVFLLGWYPDYVDVSTSVDFFALSTATPDVCSNYADEEMDRLVRAAQVEADGERRLELYREIQRKWSIDLPSLPLVQGVLTVVTRADIDGVVVDPLGLLHYDALRRGTEPQIAVVEGQ